MSDQRLTYAYQTPAEMPPARLEGVRALVAACGGVPTQRLVANLAGAYKIACALDGDQVVGTTCLKHPRPQFVERLGRLTGLDLTGWLERGYTAVAPAHRGGGLAIRLVRELTLRSDGLPIYVVIAADNPAAQGVSIANRMRPVARYFSEPLGRDLEVWICQDTPLPDKVRP